MKFALKVIFKSTNDTSWYLVPTIEWDPVYKYIAIKWLKLMLEIDYKDLPPKMRKNL